MKKQRGFIQLIFIIIIAVVILSFFGLNPKMIWSDYILPIIQFAWEALISIITFVVDIAVQLAEKIGFSKN